MISLLLVAGLSMTSSMSDALDIKSNKVHDGGLLYVEVSKKFVVTKARCEKAWDKAVILCKPFSMIPVNDECKELNKKQIQKKKRLNFEYLCSISGAE
jgi:hypothetical protein